MYFYQNVTKMYFQSQWSPGLQKGREGGKIFPGRYENQIPQRQVLLKLTHKTVMSRATGSLLAGRMKGYLPSGR